LLVLVATVAAPWADNPKEVVVNRPGVTSVTQVTRDGVSKTNLLSDETNLYVTESPAAHHVVARVSLPDVNRSVISNAFPNVQALDLSPDRSTLLVSPIQGGSDSEFWTLPVNAGSPKRVGDLTGRDATWSADGQHWHSARDQNFSSRQQTVRPFTNSLPQMDLFLRHGFPGR